MEANPNISPRLMFRTKDKEFQAHSSSYPNTPDPQHYTLPSRLSNSSVQLRHNAESPVEALKRRESRQAVVSSPFLNFESDKEKVNEIVESSDYRESGLKKLKSRSLESIARWEKENEFLFALIEDESDWLTRLFPDETITPETFFPELEDGVVLCKLARLCQNYAESYGKSNKIKIPNFHITIHPRHRCRGRLGQFMSRENVTLFLKWCRVHKIPEPLLFESNDVVEKTEKDGQREGAREIVLCLMEVARLGVKYGVQPPKLILLEKEIEAEELLDNSMDGSISPSSVDSGYDINDLELSFQGNDSVDSPATTPHKTNHRDTDEQTPTKVKVYNDNTGVNSNTNNKDHHNKQNTKRKTSIEGSNGGSSHDNGVSSHDNGGGKGKQRKPTIKSTLHDMVTSILQSYNVGKITRLKEGKYIILGKVMFVRMLNDHCIVRIGGGWDTLEHYIMTHVGKIAPNSFESDCPAKENCSPSFGLNKQKNQRRKSTDLLRRKSANYLTQSTPNLLAIDNSPEHTPDRGRSPTLKTKSRSPSPARKKDQYDIAKERKRHDQRKISEAILRVQTDVIQNRMKKSASLDWTHIINKQENNNRKHSNTLLGISALSSNRINLIMADIPVDPVSNGTIGNAPRITNEPPTPKDELSNPMDNIKKQKKTKDLTTTNAASTLKTTKTTATKNKTLTSKTATSKTSTNKTNGVSSRPAPVVKATNASLLRNAKLANAKAIAEGKPAFKKTLTAKKSTDLAKTDASRKQPSSTIASRNKSASTASSQPTSKPSTASSTTKRTTVSSSSKTTSSKPVNKSTTLSKPPGERLTAKPKVTAAKPSNTSTKPTSSASKASSTATKPLTSATKKPTTKPAPSKTSIVSKTTQKTTKTTTSKIDSGKSLTAKKPIKKIDSNPEAKKVITKKVITKKTKVEKTDIVTVVKAETEEPPLMTSETVIEKNETIVIPIESTDTIVIPIESTDIEIESDINIEHEDLLTHHVECESIDYTASTNIAHIDTVETFEQREDDFNAISMSTNENKNELNNLSQTDNYDNEDNIINSENVNSFESDERLANAENITESLEILKTETSNIDNQPLVDNESKESVEVEHVLSNEFVTDEVINSSEGSANLFSKGGNAGFEKQTPLDINEESDEPTENIEQECMADKALIENREDVTYDLNQESDNIEAINDEQILSVDDEINTPLDISEKSIQPTENIEQECMADKSLIENHEEANYDLDKESESIEARNDEQVLERELVVSADDETNTPLDTNEESIQPCNAEKSLENLSYSHEETTTTYNLDEQSNNIETNNGEQLHECGVVVSADEEIKKQTETFKADVSIVETSLKVNNDNDDLYCVTPLDDPSVELDESKPVDKLVDVDVTEACEQSEDIGEVELKVDRTHISTEQTSTNVSDDVNVAANIIVVESNVDNLEQLTESLAEKEEIHAEEESHITSEYFKDEAPSPAMTTPSEYLKDEAPSPAMTTPSELEYGSPQDEGFSSTELTPCSDQAVCGTETDLNHH